MRRRRNDVDLTKTTGDRDREFQKRAFLKESPATLPSRGKREAGTGWRERKPRRRVRGFIKETPESLPAAVRNPETVKRIVYPLSPPWRMCTVVANFNADAVRSCKYRLAGRRRSLEGTSLRPGSSTS